jgi:hypothetical protein
MRSNAQIAEIARDIRAFASTLEKYKYMQMPAAEAAIHADSMAFLETLRERYHFTDIAVHPKMSATPEKECPTSLNYELVPKSQLGLKILEMLQHLNKMDEAEAANAWICDHCGEIKTSVPILEITHNWAGERTGELELCQPCKSLRDEKAALLTASDIARVEEGKAQFKHHLYERLRQSTNDMLSDVYTYIDVFGIPRTERMFVSKAEL